MQYAECICTKSIYKEILCMKGERVLSVVCRLWGQTIRIMFKSRIAILRSRYSRPAFLELLKWLQRTVSNQAAILRCLRWEFYLEENEEQDGVRSETDESRCPAFENEHRSIVSEGLGDDVEKRWFMRLDEGMRKGNDGKKNEDSEPETSPAT